MWVHLIRVKRNVVKSVYICESSMFMFYVHVLSRSLLPLVGSTLPLSFLSKSADISASILTPHSLSSHIHSICRSAYFYLHLIGKIRLRKLKCLPVSRRIENKPAELAHRCLCRYEDRPLPPIFLGTIFGPLLHPLSQLRLLEQ